MFKTVSVSAEQRGQHIFIVAFCCEKPQEHLCKSHDVYQVIPQPDRCGISRWSTAWYGVFVLSVWSSLLFRWRPRYTVFPISLSIPWMFTGTGGECYNLPKVHHQLFGFPCINLEAFSADTYPPSPESFLCSPSRPSLWWGWWLRSHQTTFEVGS